MITRYRLPFVLAVGATLVLLPLMVSVAEALEDEAYYESWEQSRTDNREVSWMSEPILHKLKKFLISLERPQS
jgi:hypothetical protein